MRSMTRLEWVLDFDTIVSEVLNVEVGTGAADSGATLPVVVMKCWKHWL